MLDKFRQIFSSRKSDGSEAPCPVPPTIQPLEISLAEIPENGSVRRSLGEREIAIFRKGAELFAVDANCPHRRGPLDGADINGYVITCPWHGWQFDLRTGKSPAHPGQVFCYKVELLGETVRISLP